MPKVSGQKSCDFCPARTLADPRFPAARRRNDGQNSRLKSAPRRCAVVPKVPAEPVGVVAVSAASAVPRPQETKWRQEITVAALAPLAPSLHAARSRQTQRVAFGAAGPDFDVGELVGQIVGQRQQGEPLAGEVAGEDDADAAGLGFEAGVERQSRR